MNHTAVRVNGIGKRYRIGKPQAAPYKTIRETLTNGFRNALCGSENKDKKNKTEILLKEDCFWALKNISFEVKSGEVLGIIGPNGAGKSTLLKILSRITEPTDGSIEIEGRVGALLEVGTGFHPELTGRENIYLNGAIMGMRRSEILDKFNEIVDFSEVNKFLDTQVKHYSSGMYLRLAFAVAAHFEPEILVLDEVLAVGDAAFQKKCLGKMQDVTKAGRTVLFVSHNMGAVESLCSRVVWLEGGEIKKIGKPTEIISSYLLDSASRSFEMSRDSVNQRFSIQKVLLRNANKEVKTVFSPGEELRIEIQFSARERIEKPYLWISISSQYGPLLSADMTIDGQFPPFLGPGKGTIECVFRMPVLAPQTYTVRMGGREKDSITFLTKTAEVGAFRVEGMAADYGLTGPQADVSLLEGAPLFVPYRWIF